MFKKDDQIDKACYRPVSVLTALSKVYEYEAFNMRFLPNLSGYLKKARLLHCAS